MRLVGHVGGCSQRPDADRWSIDWGRLLRRLLILAPVGAALVELALQSRMSDLGFDFRGATWQAGRAILSGHSPYSPPDPTWLLHHGNGFVNSPLLAELGIPFGLLAFTPALLAFDLLQGGALILALRLVGVRDRRIDLACLCSFPFISAAVLGQPDAFLALLAAIGWRYRDSYRGAVAVGVLIAAKFLAGPLLAWLLLTRRFRQAGVAALTVCGSLLVGFAGLGFRGWSSFPSVIRADAAAFEARSHSLVAVLMRNGLGGTPALATTLVITLAVVGAVVLVARGSDLGWFTAALTFGLLCSPILWQHYLVVLLIPVGIASRDRFDPVSWTLMAALWLSPHENPYAGWQGWLVLAVVCGIALRIATLSATASGPRRSPQYAF